MFNGTAQWLVVEHGTKAAKVIDKAPHQVREKYDHWKQLIKYHGLAAFIKFPGFRDHPLKGKWQGHRSSYLNAQYRVIYRIEYETMTVFVDKIGPHDY